MGKKIRYITETGRSHGAHGYESWAGIDDGVLQKLVYYGKDGARMRKTILFGTKHSTLNPTAVSSNRRHGIDSSL